jgi:CRP-like cAMP-binding protein
VSRKRAALKRYIVITCMNERNELATYIRTFFGVSPDDVEKITSYFEKINLKKGEYFLRKGQLSDRMGFMQSGIVREFDLSEDREVTKWISTKGYFVVDISSFVFQNPSRWNIQALADSELYVISAADHRSITKVIPNWHELEKQFITKCFSTLEERVVSLISKSAKERYQHLFNFNKELFNTVPLQYLASMLGMTPETLSRLRRKPNS